MKQTRAEKEAFTLLEVMIAIAILALALTAIFSSEAGAIKVAHRARHTTTATLLARCKMAELEEDIAKEGLPAIDESGRDECCEGAEADGYACEWEIDRVVMPEEVDVGEGAEGGEDNPLSQLAAGAGAEGETPSVDQLLAGSGGDPQDAMAQMAFDFAFPVLKPAIEEQVRRATVTVTWKEGSRKHSFDVVQYMVAPAPDLPTGEQVDTLLEGL